MVQTPSVHAVSQYAATTRNLSARIALHAYGTNPQDWYSWLDELLPLAGEVLEVGAGTGRLWTRVDHVARGLDLTLTDFSPAMCAQLAAVPGAVVAQCAAESLPFGDASFDTVVASHMLYHLDDPVAALREFARVLRTGGRVAIAVNGADHLAELDAIGSAIGRTDVAGQAGKNDFIAETAPGHIADHFSEVTVQRYPCDLDIPTAEPVLAYLASRTDAPLTAEQRCAARDFIQAKIDADGVFRIGKHTVLITGSR